MAIRGSCSVTERREYELEARLDREYSDEVEKYQLISEDKEKVPDLYRDYDITTTLRTFLASEVRPKSASKCDFSKHSNINNKDGS